MKKLAPIFLTVALASAILIGCDFVDSNSSYVEADDPAQIETSYTGYYAAGVDTTGNEDPEDHN